MSYNIILWLGIVHHINEYTIDGQYGEDAPKMVGSISLPYGWCVPAQGFSILKVFQLRQTRANGAERSHYLEQRIRRGGANSSSDLGLVEIWLCEEAALENLWNT